MTVRRDPMAMAVAAVALVGGGLWAPPQKARAQAAPVVDVCTGISVDDSVLRNILSTTVVPTASTLETVVEDLLVDLPLVGTILGSITGPVDLGVAETTAAIAAGNVVGVTVLDTDGTVVGPGDDCNLAADGYTLNNEGGISIGGNQITGLGANGQAATAAEIDAIAFGNNASTAIGATGAVAIGADASATAADSVALGSGSLADRANTVSVGTVGGERQIVNVADGTAATDAATVGQMNSSIAAAVADSVNYDTAARDTLTLAGADGTRVTNVAAGSVAADSTDAVNGAQLFDTNQDVATNATAIGTLDTRLTNGEARISINEADIAALQNLSVAYDDVDGTGITLIGAGGTAISNVAAGSLAADSTDAVNGAQLFATNQNVATNQTNITAIDGRVTLNENELVTINGRLEVSEEELADLRGSAVTYDDDTQGTVTLAGADGTVMTNVAAGSLAAGSTDAVNGAQLFAMGNNTANLIGGGTVFDPATGQFIGSLEFDGSSYANVQGAITAIDAAIAAIDGGGPGSPGGGTADLKYFNTTSVAADSQARATDSTAIGPNSIANAEGAIAAGRETRAMGEGSVAIGDGSMALAGKSVAIGFANQASGDGAVAIGDPNIATGDGAVALGRDNEATGIGTVALGDTNIIAGDGAVGIGQLNQATGNGSVALGGQNAVAGDASIALGTTNQVTGSQSLALGTGNTVNADAAIAIGSNVTVQQVDALAVGNNTEALGVRSAAYGNRASAAGDDSTAIGVDATASAEFASALGEGAAATGFAATALGSQAQASGPGSVALGVNALAEADGSVALGGASLAARGAQADYAAFGTDAPQTSVGEIAIAQSRPFTGSDGQPIPIGERQITGVAAGSADTDAVNVAQLRGVSDNLGTAMASGLGGGSTYDPTTGTVSAPTYTVNGTTYSNVADAITSVASVSLQYDDVTQTTVTLAGSGGTRITNLAAGAVNASSSDAVTGAQLAATNAAVAVNRVDIDRNTTDIQTITNNLAGSTVAAVQYSSPGTPTVSNGGTITNDVTLVGADASAPVALHNVAAGTAPTDAVNVQQLQTGMANTLASAMSYTDARIQQIGFDLADLRDDAFAGTAAAMAMNAIPQTMDAGSPMFGGAVGHYRGKTAFGFGFSSAFADGQAVLKVSGTVDTQGKGGVAAGAGFAF